MMSKRKLGLLLAALGWATTVWGQSKVGTTAAPFLTIGVGSRPIAMGGAFVSVADDANALFWNPAGIARLKQPEIVLVHTAWLADMSFDYIGAVFPLGSAGTLGASATLLNVGEMEVTTETQQEGTGIFFNSYDLAAAVSYGYQIYDGFSIGTTVKYIYQQIWHETANGMAFDLGVLMLTPISGMRLGVNITNFGTELRMEGKDLLTTMDPDPTKSGNNDNVYAQIRMDSWQLPLTMRLGMSGEVLQSDRHRLTLALDWIHPNDQNEFLNVGAEYAFRETAALRIGYKGIHPVVDQQRLSPRDSGGGVTFGAGAKIHLRPQFLLKLDYAFESYDRLGNIHKYSLGFAF